MTVSSIVDRVVYPGTGTAGPFTVPFRFIQAADLLVVTLLIGASSTSPLVLGVDYQVTGAGQYTGGSLTLTATLPAGATIAIWRDPALTQTTSLQTQGAYQAVSVETMGDILLMQIQAMQDQINRSIQTPITDMPSGTVLPPASRRAGTLLGFDALGGFTTTSQTVVLTSTVTVATVAALKAIVSPILNTVYATGGYYSAGDSGGATFYWNAADTTADNGGTVIALNSGGTGRWNIVQPSMINVRQFGAKGDGVSDDIAPFTNALATSFGTVYVPTGNYLISTPILLAAGKTLLGSGEQSAVIVPSSNAVNGIIIQNSYATVAKIKVLGGNIGILMRGETGPCIENHVHELILESNQEGLVLDGYTSAAFPCYWNRIREVLILHPAVNGVHLIKSGAGDTPNANKFTSVHVYSNGSTISGSGFYVEYGNFYNEFIGCESGLNVSTPYACFRLGANANRTNIIDLYTETAGVINNVTIDAGSLNTNIINLLSNSAGAAIFDNSGGNYKTLNAGFPITNFLADSVVQSTRTGKVMYDYDGASTTPATATFYEHRYRNAIPVAGSFNRGAIVWNTNVGITNGPTGWVCVTGGTPGTWTKFGDRYLDAASTWNPPSIGIGSSANTTLSVTGALLGDIVEASFALDLQGMSLTAYVSAADTVTIVINNSTGGAIDLANAAIYARVRQR